MMTVAHERRMKAGCLKTSYFWAKLRNNMSPTQKVTGQGPIDVSDLIEARPLGRFQIGVFLLCALACFASGFNDLALGYVAPNVAESLRVSAGALGPAVAVLGAGNVLGVLICGPLADRFGRKPVMIGAMLASTPFVLATAAVHSVAQLAVIQLLASIGLMGVMPVALALAGEYAPRSRKVTIVLIVFVGFALGTIVSGIAAAGVTQSHSWRYLFVISGMLPCLIAPVLLWRLPESLHVLVQRGVSDDRVARIVGLLAPADASLTGLHVVVAEKNEHGFPVWLLFREGRALTTSLLWLMFFANVMLVMVLNSWLTTILTSAGMARHSAIIVAAAVNLGGLIGAVAFALVYDRLRRFGFFILSGAFFCGACFVVATGYVHGSVALVAATVLLAGFFAYGAQSTANAVAATQYPTAMRSTGGSWAFGVGQIARVIGPVTAGVLLSLGWGEARMLTVIAVPGFIAAVAAALIGIAGRGAVLQRVAPVGQTFETRGAAKVV